MTVSQRYNFMSESKKRCPYCGEEISINAKKCIHCKEWLEEPETKGNQVQPKHYTQRLQPAANYSPRIIVNQGGNSSNGVGTAGFIISLISVIFCWLPGVSWFVWLIGLVLSFAGLFKSPRGLAIAGMIISLIDIIILMAILNAVGSLLSSIF